jgi:peptidoglycan/xylan/chitin deacetylase (PgdA/CDA1 family)
MFKRGYISIVFDDGYEAVYRNAIPILRHHHLPAVIALPLNGEKLAKTEQRVVRPWSEWLSLVPEGFEIASHSVNHHNLTRLSLPDLSFELTESAQKLNAVTLVYPGGAVNDTVASRAAQIYQAGRTVHYGFETVPPREPMRLRSYNFSRRNFSVIKANLLVLWAWLSNSWLIETYHLIDEHDQTTMHNVRTSDFARHMSFLARLPVQVKTIKDIINLSKI